MLKHSKKVKRFFFYFQRKTTWLNSFYISFKPPFIWTKKELLADVLWTQHIWNTSCLHWIVDMCSWQQGPGGRAPFPHPDLHTPGVWKRLKTFQSLVAFLKPRYLPTNPFHAWMHWLPWWLPSSGHEAPGTLAFLKFDGMCSHSVPSNHNTGQLQLF